jgi:uncharacterized protein (DUF3084 family)
MQAQGSLLTDSTSNLASLVQDKQAMSNSFLDAMGSTSATPSVDMSQFSEALAQKRESVTDSPWAKSTAEREQKATTQTVKIENLYLQAEDCRTLLDFLSQLKQVADQGVPA